MAGSGLTLAAPDIRAKFPQDYRDPLRTDAEEPAAVAEYREQQTVGPVVTVPQAEAAAASS